MTTPAPAVFVPDYTPVSGQPRSHTFTAGADITAGQLVMIEAGEDDTVVPTGGPGPYVGIAGQSVLAGGDVTVLSGDGVLHETVPFAAVTAGQFVPPGAGGLVGAGVAGVVAGSIGVVTRGGDPGDATATPPVPPTPCRWLSYK
jgi:hypothetical protein